jgi:transposase
VPRHALLFDGFVHLHRQRQLLKAARQRAHGLFDAGDELLAANRRLMTVYVLKDDLKHLWSYRSRGHAVRFWKGWYRRAVRSRIEPLKRFARRLKEYLPGILSHCRNPLHTSVLEGINNKIKLIKRMAYGFRDHEYFFLKIRAAFPGNDG